MKNDASSNPLALAGRRALVTGAASGIGKAAAEALLAAGVTVGGLDRKKASFPEGTVPMICDVREAGAVKTAIDAFCASRGGLDILVSTIGVNEVGTVEEGPEEAWNRVFDINVMGQVRVLRAALPWLRKGEAASVIIMSSCSALNGIPRRALYSASKGAVQAMAMSIAADLVHEGIRVNCISPATVNTDMMKGVAGQFPDPEAKWREYEARQPTGKMVEPAELGLAVAYLASPLTASTTGTTLVVDGGLGTLRII